MTANALPTHEREAQRSADVVRLLPRLAGGSALDVGARDGHFSKQMAQWYTSVTALDLEEPSLHHPNITCVKGDVTRLAFNDDAFDVVVCTEVLEHIAPEKLDKACAELARVSRQYVLIGVPFKQDIRVGRTTCKACGATNPPWGHVNTFDENRLLSLFDGLTVQQLSFVGVDSDSTNSLSALLMNLARNPYGTYGQDEPCIVCGEALIEAPERSLFHKVCTKAAFTTRWMTQTFQPAHPCWMHCLFRKS